MDLVKNQKLTGYFLLFPVVAMLSGCVGFWDTAAHMCTDDPMSIDYQICMEEQREWARKKNAG